jgi:hypothetical protein
VLLVLGHERIHQIRATVGEATIIQNRQPATA